MIGYLTGKIITKKPTQVLLDVHGVGYSVNISVNTFEKLTEENSTISLYTYLSVREDALNLFGFFSLPEKQLFEILIGVNGVGPRLAISILSGIEVNEFRNAITNNNITRLVSIPGIGKKTAERMIVELKDKIYKVVPEDKSGSGFSKFAVKDDAIAALLGLGYKQKTAEQTTGIILEKNPSLSIEELIKEALKILNK